MNHYDLLATKKHVPYASIIALSLIAFLAVSTALYSAVWIAWGAGNPLSPNGAPGLAGLKVLLSSLVMPQTWSGLGNYLSDYGLWSAFVGRVIFPPALALVFSIFVAVSMIRNHSRAKEIITEGPQLYKYKEAIVHANAAIKKVIKPGIFSKADPLSYGISVHPQIAINRRAEVQNALWIGTVGSGKTTTLVSVVDQFCKRGDKIFLFAKKQEMVRWFYDSSNSYLISPTDNRSSAWDIAADCRTPLSATVIAERFIPANGRDNQWALGARMLLSAIIISLMSDPTKKSRELIDETTGRKIIRGGWSWLDLSKKLKLSAVELINIVKTHYPQAQFLLQEDSETSQGYLVNMVAYLDFVHYLADAWADSNGERGMSILDWVNDPSPTKNRLIIAFNTHYEELSKSIFSIFLTFTGRAHQALPDDDSRRIVYELDEFASVRNPDIVDFIADLRGRGGVFLLGIQEYAQFEEIYGEKIARTIFGQCNIIYGMRVSADTARTLEATFGEQTFERRHVTLTATGESISYAPDTRPVVSASQFQRLPQANQNGCEGYLLIKGIDAVYRLKWKPYKFTHKLAAGYIEAKWLTDEAKKYLDSYSAAVSESNSTASAQSTPSTNTKPAPSDQSRTLPSTPADLVDITISESNAGSANGPDFSPEMEPLQNAAANELGELTGVDAGVFDTGFKVAEIASELLSVDHKPDGTTEVNHTPKRKHKARI